MGLNIFDKTERKVRCIRNDKDGMMVSSDNHHLLEVGKEYTLTNTEVHPWYTVITLKEFPGKTFNSVVFNEIGKEQA